LGWYSDKLPQKVSKATWRCIGAYIQSVVLKRTFESISLEFRRSGELVARCRDNMVETAVRRLYSEEENDLQLQNPSV
jgi:hypothetical protein